MWQQLCDLLDHSAECHILLLGDFMIDRYLYGDADRISPEAPVPVLRVVREEDALGGAGSVAADIAALGAIPHCVGVTGNGADAKRLVDLIDAAGADGSGLLRTEGRKTTRKTRLVGLAQHRHRQQLIRIDDESNDPIDEETTQRLLGLIEARLDRCRVLCIEDYDKGVITPDLAKGAIAAARRRNIPILVDPANIADYARYAGATLGTPNRSETEKLTGLDLGSLDKVREAATTILAACRTENTCLTLDADGAALIGPGGAFEHIPTKKRDVYDVTGAGDMVLAALAVGIAAGGEIREAVHLANVAGGLEVEKFGCVPITKNEVLGEIMIEHHRALGKLRTLDQLLPELARRRTGGATVGFTNGCFDILHAGHVATFAFSKMHADILVVGLNSDRSVKMLGKGNDRPVVGQQDRANLLAALSDVDYVVIFDEETPLRLIEAILPDVLAKGEDWRGREVVGRAIVENNGGKILFVPLVDGCSSTEIIERIRGSN